MKKLSLLFLVVSTFAFAKFDGGISGGGGNVINPTPPNGPQDPKEVRHVIKESRRLLLGFLYKKQLEYKAGKMSSEDAALYVRFFEIENDEEDLCEITKDIKIEIPTDKACFDMHGNEYDGSAFNPKEKSICISAFRIAQKTSMKEVPVQSAALMLHEFGEALGLSDEDAVRIQAQAIKELKIW